MFNTLDNRFRIARGKIVEVTGYFREYIVAIRANGAVLNLPCCLGTSTYTPLHGANNQSMLPVGTPVLITYEGAVPRNGIILTALPGVRIQAKESKEEKLTAVRTAMESGGGSQASNPLRRRMDIRNITRYDYGSTQSPDTLPGEKIITTDTGGLLALRRYVSGLMASANCGVEFNSLDDYARFLTRNLSVFTALGVSHTWNDEGDLLFEWQGASQQYEAAGFEGYSVDGDPLTGNFTYEEVTPDGKNCGLADTKPQLPPLARLYMYSGAVADLVQLFACYPGNEGSAINKSNIGLFHTSLSSNGALRLRTASGFSLTRSGFIPVPLRQKMPWDLEGDTKTGEEKIKEEPKLPFKWSETYPDARSLQLQEYVAYNNAKDLQRFDERPKDFMVPDGDKILPADDVNDIPTGYDRKGSKADIGTAVPLEAGVFVDEDGNVFLRSAHGAEIALVNGKLTLSGLAMTVQTAADVVVLAGRDTVIKSRKSVDITTTENDVRIKAHKSMQMYTKAGGILLQTDSVSGPEIVYSGEGDTAATGGIALKAAEGAVLVYGKFAELAGQQQAKVTSIAGAVQIVCKSLQAIGNSIVVATKGAALYISSQMAALAGGSVMLAGKNTSVWQDDKPGAILYGSSTGVKSPYTAMVKDIGEPLYDTLTATTLDVSTLMFKFRDRVSYHTESATFAVYQTPWQMLRDSGITTTPATTTWTEEAVNETFPWPGEEKGNALLYVTLPTPANYRLTKEGAPVSRAAVTPEGGALQAVSLDKYTVAI